LTRELVSLARAIKGSQFRRLLPRPGYEDLFAPQTAEDLFEAMGRQTEVREMEEAATNLGREMLRPSPDEPRITTVCSVCGRDITETLRCPTCLPREPV
jgi:hypothetical protein